MRIGITGASGMLGRSLAKHLSKTHKVLATARSRGVEGQNIEWECFDIMDAILLKEWLERCKPDIVIHCAAMVNVDKCEDNANLAMGIHAKSTAIMADFLNKNNGRLVYISTDSVFDGNKQGSYIENDTPNPINIYAQTKLAGEQAVLSIKKGLVLRVSIIGWTREGSTSFAEWLVKGLTDKTPLNLFYDVHFSPLHVDSLSLIVEKIIGTPVYGLYHCASSDSISKYEFGIKMAQIFRLCNSNINRSSVEDVNFKAKRPKNMALSSQKLAKKIEYDMPSYIHSIKLMKCQYDKNNKLLN